MPEIRSKLISMTVRNIGCIGSEGVTVALDDVVCIVGRNNSGKSTILRAYELAQGVKAFDWSTDRHAHAQDDEPSEVILEVHIPDGIGTVDNKWKEPRGDLRIVTSRWQWRMDHEEGKKPKRETRDPTQDLANNDGYALEGKAGSADNVFKSRLPQPVRIGSRSDPVEAEQALVKLVLEPVSTALTAATSDATSELGHAVGHAAGCHVALACFVDDKRFFDVQSLGNVAAGPVLNGDKEGFVRARIDGFFHCKPVGELVSGQSRGGRPPRQSFCQTLSDRSLKPSGVGCSFESVRNTATQGRM